MNSNYLDNMFFSCLSGYNMYVPSQFQKDTMTHLLSDTEVTVRPIKQLDDEIVQTKWRHFIEHPINPNHATWPIDIVSLGDGKMGLIFKKRSLSKLQPIKNVLYRSILLGKEKEDVQKLTRNLLNAFIDMHDCGYAYHAFDIEKIFYNVETKEVVFDFTLGMSRHRSDVGFASDVDPEAIGIEFLPPWIDFDNRSKLSLADDYYSIAALLFRLFIGRMPYQGRLMHTHGNNNIMEIDMDVDPAAHLNMFTYYHEHPVFIFDPDDDSNNVGEVLADEKQYVSRWNELPENVRDMFIKTFSKQNIEHGIDNYDKMQLFTPRQWMDALTNANII